MGIWKLQLGNVLVILMLVDEIILSCKLKLTESALEKKKKVVLHSTLLVVP